MSGGSTNCMVYCVIGFTLLVAMLWTMMAKSSAVGEFEKNLDKYQRKKYSKLVLQRRNNALIGMAIGVVIAIGAFSYFKTTMPEVNLACVVTTIVMLSTIAYYMLAAPKQTMIDYLETDQYPLWMDAHKAMVRNFGAGLIIGMGGYFLLSMGSQDLFCGNCEAGSHASNDSK